MAKIGSDFPFSGYKVYSGNFKSFGAAEVENKIPGYQGPMDSCRVSLFSSEQRIGICLLIQVLWEQ
jgi:hypothetical protein